MGFLNKIFSRTQSDYLEKTPFANPIEVEFHNHTIFGVDDGCENIEQSIELLRGFANIGMRKVIATPHIMSDFYKNSADNLLPLLKILQQKLVEENIPIQLECAAEYLIDDGFERKIEDGNLMTFGSNKKHILVELPFMDEPPNLKEAIFDLQIAGYIPVLAHPERYLYFNQNKTRYHDLKDQGILFQLNLLSTIAYYGPPVYDLAVYLVKNNLIDMVGSDTHNDKHQSLLPLAYKSKLFKQLSVQTELLNKYL